MDITELYQSLILDHNRSPRNHGAPAVVDRVADGRNPMCGDQLRVWVTIDDEGRVTDVRFAGKGCAISQASASLMTERLKGLTLEEARKINKDDVLGELGIEISPARIKCALLSLKVLKVGAYGLAGEDEDEE